MRHETGHGLHYLAAYAALEKQLGEVRAAAEGRAGASASPDTRTLPTDIWAVLSDRLAGIEAAGLRLATRHAPDRVREKHAPVSEAAAARRISLLLRRMEEALEDLQPERVARRFGPFPDEEDRRQSDADAIQMRQLLTEAIDLVEKWRLSLNRVAGDAQKRSNEP